MLRAGLVAFNRFTACGRFLVSQPPVGTPKFRGASTIRRFINEPFTSTHQA
jgi:hypothetical protein